VFRVTSQRRCLQDCFK